MMQADRYVVIALVLFVCIIAPIFFFASNRPRNNGFLVPLPFAAFQTTPTHRNYGMGNQRWTERFRDNATIALAMEFQIILNKWSASCNHSSELFRAEFGANPCKVTDVLACLSDSIKDAHCYAFLEALFNEWVSQKMACRDCESCRSLIVEFRSVGIGSVINSMVQLLGTALDSSRQLVYQGSWDFANRRTCPPGKDNWLCFYLHVNSCEKEPQSSANTRVAANFAEFNALSGELHVLIPAHMDIRSFKPRIFHRLKRLFTADHSFIWGLFLKRLMRFNSEHAPFISNQISDALGPTSHGAPKLNAGLHIRGAEFTLDDRKAIAISEYFARVDGLNASLNKVYIATDLPHITGAFLHLARPPLSRHRLFMHQRAKLPVGVPVATIARDQNSRPGFDVNELALEGFADVMILSHADYFLGTSSNWQFVVTSLMAPTIPPHRKCVLVLEGETSGTLAHVCDGDAASTFRWDSYFFGPPE